MTVDESVAYVCPVCAEPVEAEAEGCPHCGASFVESRAPRRSWLLPVVSTCAAGLVIAMSFLPQLFVRVNGIPQGGGIRGAIRFDQPRWYWAVADVWVPPLVIAALTAVAVFASSSRKLIAGASLAMAALFLYGRALRLISGFVANLTISQRPAAAQYVTVAAAMMLVVSSLLVLAPGTPDATASEDVPQDEARSPSP
ncbi:MAG: hypothetical protein ABR552_10100 [Actinomycetota bacterium]|nr:zinc ribbon domain-containing protein [Actinomycetota bacterium]